MSHNYPTDHEPHNRHGHDMSSAHFPIKTKPVSLKGDLDSRMTLSSKNVQIELGRLHNKMTTKQMGEFLEDKATDPVILSAETFLEITELEDNPDEPNWKQIAIYGGIGAFLMGILGYYISESSSIGVLIVALIAAGLGGCAGYFYHWYEQQQAVISADEDEGGKQAPPKAPPAPRDPVVDLRQAPAAPEKKDKVKIIRSEVETFTIKDSE